jgi:hypothetical protein
LFRWHHHEDHKQQLIQQWPEKTVATSDKIHQHVQGSSIRTDVALDEMLCASYATGVKKMHPNKDHPEAAIRA